MLSASDFVLRDWSASWSTPQSSAAAARLAWSPPRSGDAADSAELPVLPPPVLEGMATAGGALPAAGRWGEMLWDTVAGTDHACTMRLREHEHCTRTAGPAQLQRAHQSTATGQSPHQHCPTRTRWTRTSPCKAQRQSQTPTDGTPTGEPRPHGLPHTLAQTAAAPLHTLRLLHPRPPAHNEGATPFPSTTSSAMHPAAPRPPTPAHTHSPRPARLAHNTALRPKTATATPTRQHSNPSARAEQPPLCARSPAQRPTPGAESTAAPASAR